mgnify:FL=1
MKLTEDKHVEHLLQDMSSCEEDFAEYVENTMDPVYAVDHDKTDVLTPEETYFLNTGQRLSVKPEDIQ